MLVCRNMMKLVLFLPRFLVVTATLRVFTADANHPQSNSCNSFSRSFKLLVTYNPLFILLCSSPLCTTVTQKESKLTPPTTWMLLQHFAVVCNHFGSSLRYNSNMGQQRARWNCVLVVGILANERNTVWKEVRAYVYRSRMVVLFYVPTRRFLSSRYIHTYQLEYSSRVDTYVRTN